MSWIEPWYDYSGRLIAISLWVEASLNSTKKQRQDEDDWIRVIAKQIYLKDIRSKGEVIAFKMCNLATAKITWPQVKFNLFRVVKKET